jgi:hypothetical protein
MVGYVLGTGSSFYQYNGTPIDSICKYKDASKFSKFTNNLGLTIAINPINNVNIDEKPVNMGYKVDGQDISNFCIAFYTDSTSSGGLNIPSWCKALRVIMIGGGGQGVGAIAGVAAQQFDQSLIQQNGYHLDEHYNRDLDYADDQHHTHEHQQQNHTHHPDNHTPLIHTHVTAVQAKPAYNGGGGGYVYISKFTFEETYKSTIQITQSSNQVNLSYQYQGTKTITCNNGGNATSGAGAGAGSEVQISNLNTINGYLFSHSSNNIQGYYYYGQSGSQNNGKSGVATAYQSIPTALAQYGNGGLGDGAGPGGSYYRVYYLTG